MITTTLVSTDPNGTQHFNVFLDGVLIGTDTTAPIQPAQLIAQSVAANLASIEAWITANPSGAVLTAAQTLFVAKMLAGLARLTLDLVGTVGQTQ